MKLSGPKLTRFWAFALAWGVFLSAATPMHAHKPSDSYLTVRATPAQVTGEWHLALRDLEDAIGLDADDNGAITWDELRSRQTALSAYAGARLHLRSGQQSAQLRITELLVDHHSDGAYAVLRFTVDRLASVAALEVQYRALFDLDPSHRGLLRLEHGGRTRLAIFSPTTSTQHFDLTTPAPRTAWLTFVKEGMWHIWTGYDHFLFLLALLLPGVLRHGADGWEPVVAARPAFVNVLKVVTAFTVAHSITLSLAALGIVHLPARLVESAIAASVVLAALNNLVPFFAERGWLVAFGFGLLHGFGFANALGDLGLRHGDLAITLFGFNLGVELGQLLIVALFLPLALAVRHLLFYRHFVLRAGSVAIIAVAVTWFAERALDFKWLPF